MNKLTKRVSTAFLVISLLLASCGGNSSSGGSSSSAQSASSGDTASVSQQPEEYTLPLVTDGSVTLTVGTWYSGTLNPETVNDLPVWKKFEEDTGVKVEWELTPNTDYNTVMQTRLAAAEDLPDFINVPGGDVIKYVTAGVVQPITEQLQKYAYNTMKLYEENPYLKSFVTAPDGEIYSFTSDVSGSAKSDPYSFYIRKDWLDKFNLDLPETVDDWYTAWKTFLDNDANGNGLKDEIPLCNDVTLRGVLAFSEAWGLRTFASLGWSINDQGQVEYDYIKPEMKEALTWLNKCYSEGLIDKEFMTQTSDMILSKVSQNQAGSCFRFLNGVATWNNVLETSGIDGEYVAVAPPSSGTTGTEPFIERYGRVSGHYAFTNKVEDLETKIKFIDYIYASQEGSWNYCFGVEGQSYEVVDNIPQYTEWATKNPDGLTLNNALLSLGCNAVSMPWNRSVEGIWSYQPLQSISSNPKTVEYANMIQDYIVESYPNGMLMTEEESSTIAQYQADLDTYRDEMMAKFITGQESLDKFDTFVSTIQGMHLDDVKAVKQAIYDRYVAAMGS